MCFIVYPRNHIFNIYHDFIVIWIIAAGLYYIIYTIYIPKHYCHTQSLHELNLVILYPNL